MACSPTMATTISGTAAVPAGMRRSHSDPQLRCSLNAVRASSSGEPLLKNNNSPRSAGIFPFPFTGSILPNSLRSFLDHSIFEGAKEDKRLPESQVLTENSGNNVKNAEAMVGGLGLVVEKMPENSKDLGSDAESGDEQLEKSEKRANWVMRLLELRSQWKNRQKEQGNKERDGEKMGEDVEDDGCCDADLNSEIEEFHFDKESFSRLLVRIPLSETKVFAQLSFLCNLAYVIPEIKAGDLWRYYRLRFVTSSLVKKAEAACYKAKLDSETGLEPEPSQQKQAMQAYGIAASAASYVHSRTQSLLHLTPGTHDDATDVNRRVGRQDPLEPEEGRGVHKGGMAAFVTASTVTAVVAAEEEAKQAAALDLRSLHSSPCEWFVCDDLSSCTRCFVIQGSDSLASWQANLFFDPTNFEGMDVLVHRGIYEAAKGIYEQFMPEILSHLRMYGERARFRFTGHSLGGSLSLLVNLMLLKRGVVKPSVLLPVVTFGSPFVLCGGCKVLEDLGLAESHVLSVMMHRDIVPRAFSCNYPDHVAQVLRRLSKALRAHPCLNNNKLLYSPLGRLFILQPDEKASPPHPWLPQGSALYVLDKAQGGSHVPIMGALRAFLNNPHPLETLKDPTAYGSEGSILRDHDSSNYLKAVNGVLRQQTKQMRRLWREQRRQGWWPVLTASPHVWTHDGNIENAGLVELASAAKVAGTRVEAM